jgi:pimeloyl-ACP methyl ester carboxylesterase
VWISPCPSPSAGNFSGSEPRPQQVTPSEACSRRWSPDAGSRPSRWQSTPRPSGACCPLPISALKAASPVLGNPANRHSAVPLTYDQFRYAFANAVSEEEAKELYETYAVPTPGAPLFQAATANLNPWTEATVDTKNPDREPLLLISGEKDQTVPPAIANASYKKQERNQGVTEIVEIPDRGHALTIDKGWREVADTALAFVQRFTIAEEPGRSPAQSELAATP